VAAVTLPQHALLASSGVISKTSAALGRSLLPAPMAPEAVIWVAPSYSHLKTMATTLNKPQQIHNKHTLFSPSQVLLRSRSRLLDMSSDAAAAKPPIQ
jgi:hypothetical protein